MPIPTRDDSEGILVSAFGDASTPRSTDRRAQRAWRQQARLAASMRRSSAAQVAVLLTACGLSLLALVATLASAAAGAVSAQATATVTGRVVNGTAGAELPEQLEVFVLVIDEGQEAIVERVSVVVDERGEFAVQAPALQDGQFYRVVADDGVYTPFTDLVSGAGESTDALDATLTVYARTTSLDQVEGLSYGVVFPVVDAAEQVIAVLSAISFTNVGNEVYVADLADPALTGVKLLRFNLPEGYAGLNVESDLPSGNVMEINTGFALSNPVPPGEWNLVANYSVPYADGVLAYPFRLPFGAERVSFLLPVGSGEISGLGLVRGENVTLNETEYVQYEGVDYPRGSQLDVVVSGLPSPGFGSQFADFLASAQFQVAVGVTVGLLLLGTLTSVVLLRRAPGELASAGRPLAAAGAGSIEGNDGGDDSGDRDTIIAAIAELDRRHDAGDLETAAYAEERRRLVQAALDATTDG